MHRYFPVATNNDVQACSRWRMLGGLYSIVEYGVLIIEIGYLKYKACVHSLTRLPNMSDNRDSNMFTIIHETTTVQPYHAVPIPITLNAYFSLAKCFYTLTSL